MIVDLFLQTAKLRNRLLIYSRTRKNIKEIQHFQTSHVETVVLLGRKMVKDKSIEYMHVDYEPEDNEYMRGIKGSATYAEIKAWNKKQYLYGK